VHGCPVKIEGKYHRDGHRACDVPLDPKETIALGGRYRLAVAESPWVWRIAWSCSPIALKPSIDGLTQPVDEFHFACQTPGRGLSFTQEP
jgi:hypothetical protein